MSKVIITVVGKDTVGIIAKVCTYLAGKQVNILDISQTILQGSFTMVMAVDVGDNRQYGLRAGDRHSGDPRRQRSRSADPRPAYRFP